MDTLAAIVLMAWLAGAGAFAGGLLARFEGTPETPLKREWVHAVTAFGGGILAAAVAFALLPLGMAVLSPALLAAAFCAGGAGFCALDAWLARRVGPRAQFAALLADFVPEAVSMGALFAHDPRLGALLAAFIALQNLPEGFNAYRERVGTGARPRRALRALLIVSLLGPAAALAGHLLLQEREALTATLMAFAGGGLLYLLFQDIAPKSIMRRHWTPPLGAVLGFALGMLGKQLLG